MGAWARQVVADALVHEVRDPRVGFVTVTGVRVTNELSHANIAVSIMGDEAETVNLAWAFSGIDEQHTDGGFRDYGRLKECPMGQQCNRLLPYCQVPDGEHFRAPLS